MTTVIPEQENISLGSTITHNGVNLIADREFAQGKDAKASGLEYFMFTNKGVIGFKING